MISDSSWYNFGIHTLFQNRSVSELGFIIGTASSRSDVEVTHASQHRRLRSYKGPRPDDSPV